MIGTGLVEQTYTTVGASTGYTAVLNTTHTNSGTVFTTFTGYLPILVLALVGSYALYYIVRSLLGFGGQVA
jgi:hypothetical protein